jgi:predicted alpha-1,6-mannanase (GH76 family)
MGNVLAFSSSNADQAASTFVSTYWNSSTSQFYENSDHNTYAAHGGEYEDFWWTAETFESVMDAYQRTNSSTYRNLIDSIYTGFFANNVWQNDTFNDDKGWWALACVRAYELTGEQKFLTQAKAMFDNIYTYQSSDFGGGIWWTTSEGSNSSNAEKNIATNAPAVMTAVKLSNDLNDSSYLTKAQSLYSWMRSTLYNSATGQVADHVMNQSGSPVVSFWDFSYNYGTFLGAGLSLYEQNPSANGSYLTDANAAATWAVNYLTLNGTMYYEGENDSPLFKIIFMRNLNNLRVQANEAQYLGFLQANASQAWNHVRSDGLIGPDWTATSTESYIQISAATAGMDILQFVPADNATSVVLGPGQYDAQNGVLHSLGSESTNPGFSGRGYIDGWDADGEWVDFNVNVPSSGTYTCILHYAADGNASRYIVANGQGIYSNLQLPATGAWTNWNTVEFTASLNAGTNTISVIYNSSMGSSNYLNLDTLTLGNLSSGQRYEAENGTLHSLTTESSNSGYTGSGYIAGWNANGQWVDFTVDAANSGNYNLTFRFAAANGSASRYLYVNGQSIVANQTFQGTNGWSDYQTVTITGVPLNAGSNTISLIYNSSQGSTNYLNLDNLTVGP